MEQMGKLYCTAMLNGFKHDCRKEMSMYVWTNISNNELHKITRVQMETHVWLSKWIIVFKLKLVFVILSNI